METIENALKNNLPGLYYGNRILLPFSCWLLKIIIIVVEKDKDIFDFNNHY